MSAYQTDVGRGWAAAFAGTGLAGEVAVVLGLLAPGDPAGAGLAQALSEYQRRYEEATGHRLAGIDAVIDRHETGVAPRG